MDWKEGAATVTSRMVSIGMPVYNGGEELRHALDSILAQSHAEFELIISDNASTEGVTQTLTEEYARRDPRIRLTRQPANQGVMANFLWVLQQSQGDYFMWAAHDDAWSQNDIEALADRLDESPDAVLATPRTNMERVSKSGAKQMRIIPETPSVDRWGILDAFLSPHTCVWFYGLYRTTWLNHATEELKRYPILGADRIWLFDLLSNHRTVGASNATFYYSCVDGKPKNRTTRTRMRDLEIESYHMARIALEQASISDRAKGLYRVLRYLYWHKISRGNPVGTLIRIVKLVLFGTWFGLEAGVRRVAGLRG